MTNAQNLIGGAWVGEPIIERRNPANPMTLSPSPPRPVPQTFTTQLLPPQTPSRDGPR